MKTIKQWLEAIADADMRAKALAALEKAKYAEISPDQYAESFQRALAKGFNWAKTDEGHDYWLVIAKNADKVIIQ